MTTRDHSVTKRLARWPSQRLTKANFVFKKVAPLSGRSSQAAAAAAAAPKTFTGTGSKVTDHFQLKQGSYKLTWKATGGSDNFQVTAHWAGDNKGLVNEIPPNPSSGETVFDAPITGDYYLEVAASTLTWTITLAPA